MNDMTPPHNEQLRKGIARIFLGLAFALLPYVLTLPDMYYLMFALSLVGWFLLTMGITLVYRHFRPHKDRDLTRPTNKL